MDGKYSVCRECQYCSLPIPGYWIPAIPAGMTVWWVFAFARHPGMDAGTHRPWMENIQCVENVNIAHFPSLVTGFRHKSVRNRFAFT